MFCVWLRVISWIGSELSLADWSTKSHEKSTKTICVGIDLPPRSYVSMIRSLVIVLFWLSLALPVVSQIRSPKPLELTAEIISQNYCAVNEDAASLEITLRLRYRNVGKQKIILYNGHDLFYQTKIRTAQENPAGPYEVWVVNSRYFDEEIEAIDQPSPGKVFIRLAPGAIHQREILIGVEVVTDKIDRGQSSIRSGDHTLQLIASNWYQSRAMAQKLRQEWQKKGVLWSDPLDSRPIHFLAQRPAALVRCK